MAGVDLMWDIGLIIISATLLGNIVRAFKQPLIPAYVLAGIIIGPWLGLITNPDVIRILSELGIAFLLFIVGLELDLRRLQDVGLSSSIQAFVQSIAAFICGYLLGVFLGFTDLEAVYIGLTLSFSSTMVLIKILSDKNELDTLHGRILLGILLTEDVFAVFAMSLLGTVEDLSWGTVSTAVLNGVGLFAIAIAGSRYVFPHLLKFVARSHELLFLTGLSLCFLFAKLAVEAGFSIAIGAFMAGVAIATFPYNLELIGRVRSLRDFFATIFFVSLGLEIPNSVMISEIFLPCLILIGVTVTIKPLLAMVTSAVLGFSRKTNFLIGIGLTQIGEFSLIIITQGYIDGHVSSQVFTITAIVATVTITITSYLFSFENELFKRVSHHLTFLTKLSRNRTKKVCSLTEYPIPLRKHVIICGCHRMGYAIGKTLRELKRNFVVLEYNPEIIQTLMDRNIKCVYGDLGDIEAYDKIALGSADLVISTVVNDEDNRLLITEAKKRNEQVVVFVTADTMKEAIELYEAGADYVIIPRMLGGEKVSEFVETYVKDKHKVEELRLDHLRELDYLQEEEVLEKYEPLFLRRLEDKLRRPLEDRISYPSDDEKK